MTSEDPPTRCKPGRCIARACLKPRFRLARAATLATPDKPRVRGILGAKGALANGISVERDVDGTGRTEGSGLSEGGAVQCVTGLPGIVSSHSKELS